MAKTVDEVPASVGTGAKAKYPWDQWLDGQAWQLEQSVVREGEYTEGDFVVTAEKMRAYVINAARRRGLEVTTRVRHEMIDGIEVGFVVFQVTGAAPEKVAEPTAPAVDATVVVVPPDPPSAAVEVVPERVEGELPTVTQEELEKDLESLPGMEVLTVVDEAETVTAALLGEEAAWPEGWAPAVDEPLPGFEGPAVSPAESPESFMPAVEVVAQPEEEIVGVDDGMGGLAGSLDPVVPAQPDEAVQVSITGEPVEGVAEDEEPEWKPIDPSEDPDDPFALLSEEQIISEIEGR